MKRQEKRVEEKKLDARPRPDNDAALVTAEHGLRPNRRAGSDHNVADDRAIRMHEGVGIDAGHDVTESVKGHAH